MLPAFPNVTTQIDTDHNDVDLDDLKSSVLSNKQVMLKWIRTTERQLEDEIKLTKTKILTESKKEINYVDEILKEKLTITAERGRAKDATRKRCPFVIEAQNPDQLSIKQRCSFILSNNQQCPNFEPSGEDKEESQFCQRHRKLVKKRNENKDKKDAKEKASKTKRKYVKSNGTTNENKPRKKKDAASLPNGESSISATANGQHPVCQEAGNQQRQSNSLIDNLAGSDFSKSQQHSFTPFVNSTGPNACYSTDLNDDSTVQYGYTTIAIADHHYAPCPSNGLNTNGNLNGNTNLNNNLNQLSSLTHSEDSLTLAIAGNADDLASVPLEESELTEMLGKMGKIPDDAFNDIYLMDNLSTESSELRAIDNIAFNSDHLDNLEPSISNQTFTPLNFKNGSNGFFSQVSADQQQNSQLLNSGNLIYSNSDMSNLNAQLNLNGGGELICISNGLISANGLCGTMSNTMTGSVPVSSATGPQSNYSASFGVLDYKPQVQQYTTNVIHQSAYTSGPTDNSSFNSNYLHPNVSTNYPPAPTNGHLLSGSDNGQASMHSNGHSNHLLNGYTGGSLSNSLQNNLSVSSNLATPSSLSVSFGGQLPASYLDCAPTVKNDDKKFNLFSNCKSKPNGNAVYQTTYSNIYDGLPAFEPNRPNGASSSLPSFSIMKKNRIESR